jgi:transcription-repair coupling factor (superfamily II helicase)
LILSTLLPFLRETAEFKTLARYLEEEQALSISAPSFFRPFLLASLFESLAKTVLLVTAHTERAEELYQDLGNFVSAGKLRYFPSWETFGFEQLSPNRELVGSRMEVLFALGRQEPLLLIAPLGAVLQRIAPPSERLFVPIVLDAGERKDLSRLLQELARSGYSRSYMVEGRGEFSARGGIVDIYPVTGSQPLRIEFLGDEIESIRAFDLSSQRSLREETHALIFPCHEVSLTPQLAKRAEERLSGRTKDQFVQEDLERLRELIYFEGVERYLPLFYPKLSTLLDYLPPASLVVLDEPKELSDAGEFLHQQQTEFFGQAFWGREALADFSSYYASWEDMKRQKQFNTITLASLMEVEAGKPSVSFNAETIEPLLGNFDRLEKMVRQLDSQSYRFTLVVEGQGQGERIAEMFRERQLNAHFETERPRPVSHLVSVTNGRLSRGFIAPFLKLALLSDGDIFRPRRKRRLEKQTTTYLPISSFADLKVGDYVVHINHGIGRYLGLVTQEIAGVIRDYMLIEYARGDKLYVPTDQMHRVQKYIGADAEPPKLSHLGGTEWARTKKRVGESVKSLAIDLLELYSERMRVQGHAFSPDSVWQRELEEAFPYDETPDQMRAIQDVKGDMEEQKPMDRLICGDVGYGKTEVALRAAFKSLMDGKQVVVLVPTTVLAQQHYSTFTERLAVFPVNVEVLSRFRNRREQQEILRDLKEGRLDIVIGTHRLLQKDVDIKDPGLIIVDEEQRFGVGHKEQLKELRKSVDVLTLTATPIPRTLQMSLSGVRDLSVINTPPEDRYPVFTYVGEFDENMITLAIRRELARDGQVFFVHNRVQTIESTADYVRRLVPEARVAVAHGQMPEQELERVMQDFIAHKHDVLTCTTIIESGLDIPNVNTLIVGHAERFGLSTLYQLRGRVGRAHHRAYAYFFFSPGQNLTGAARDRLKTIGEFTELGSGLKIALRDLEIRGAGNLLGPEQHGHMASVGFELYCQILKDAVDELRGERKAEPHEVKIDVLVSAHIPESYIPEEALRIEAYRKIAAVDTGEKKAELERELADRYGPLPREVSVLLGVCELKILARRVGIKKISQEEEKVALWPVRLSPRLERSLSRMYQGVFYRPRREALAVKLSRGDDSLAFLRKLIGDIIAFGYSV